MSIEIKSPTFPESVADGTIANWVKKEGEPVKQDEVIAEIETDKVVLEVVAPFDGVISKVLKPAGEIVLSAELIAEFKEENHDKKLTEKDTLVDSEAKKVESVQPSEVKTKANGPAVKKLLKEHNLDEASIDGSGKDGRLTKADVVNHLDESLEGKTEGMIAKEIHSPSPVPTPVFQPRDQRRGFRCPGYAQP